MINSKVQSYSKNKSYLKKSIVVLFLLLLLLIFLLWLCAPKALPREAPPEPISAGHTDTATLDTPLQAFSPTQSSPPPHAPVPHLVPIQSEPETPDLAIPPDTVPPTVQAIPTGGLYYMPVTVKLTSDEPCSIFVLQSGNPISDVNRKQIHEPYKCPLAMEHNVLLYFYAVDTAGNISPIKVRQYDFNLTVRNPCPRNMTMVFSAQGRFCIDQYEWPNRRYTTPKNFISWHQAHDSCTAAGKRLCTAGEWSDACSDFGRQAYAYGNGYEPQACVTEKSGPEKSGKSPECMSYFGVFDMSGNLQEWTNSPAPQNPIFFKVMGGFHSSYSLSRCQDYKYSFYPQNPSVSVGFRCCFDP